MRIISGKGKGHRSIRPTLGKVREAIFNSLFSKGVGFDMHTMVLDLFAGSGALGIEALRRGAGKVIFVDRDRVAVGIIKKNLKACGFGERADILPIDVVYAIPILRKKGCRFDLIFLDPPYDRGLVMRTLREVVREDLLESEGWIVAEHSKREIPQESLDGIKRMDIKTYGQTVVSFYCNEWKAMS